MYATTSIHMENETELKFQILETGLLFGLFLRQTGEFGYTTLWLHENGLRGLHAAIGAKLATLDAKTLQEPPREGNEGIATHLPADADAVDPRDEEEAAFDRACAKAPNVPLEF